LDVGRFFLPATPLRQQHLNQQQPNRHAKRPVITLVHPLHEFLLAFRLGQRRETLFVERINRLRPAHRQIKPTLGRASDLLEQSFVQPRLHRIAIGVAQIISPTFCILDAQDFTFRCADADGENLHAFHRGGLRGFERFLVVVFAIGEQH
jgi:hypothetical protein